MQVQGVPVNHGKPPRGDEYLSFTAGSLFSPCTKTQHYNSHYFMPHHSLQASDPLGMILSTSYLSCVTSLLRLMRGFRSDAPLPSPSSYDTESVTQYLLPRDEDCENSFHSTADFLNMYLVLSALKVSPADIRVMLFDKYSDGPYIELIQKAFSPSHTISRPRVYGMKTVSLPDPMRCRSAGLFDGYRRFVLQAFGLLDVPPPAIPSVLVSLRHRTPQKNVGRIMGNEAEVLRVLREGNMMNLKVLDTATLSFGEQLK
eukprot:gene2825-3441_t